MKIGIICAMDKEIGRYFELYDLKLKDEKREIYEADNIIIARCGIGKVNSSIMVQHLIDKYNVDLVISSGCAGALTDEFNVMDVVVPKYVTYHDFLPERVMKYSTPDNGHIKVEENLRNLFKQVMDEENIKYIEEAICSGDSYVTDDITAKEIVERTGAKVVDMESASIGHTARVNGIPFITIRTISDFANGDDSFELKASIKASEIIYKCVNKLTTKLT